MIYQVYVRSFADSDGDGTGDLRGVRSRLGYLNDLGVDALWFTPWYPSPLADGGYDVTDYRDIHPDFGTLDDAELLVSEALALGIRTIIDVVPNHVSSEHPWFQAALAAGPGSPERERFWFHPGKGPNGDEMPTHWVSNFEGETWTRTTNPDGTPGEWYLHLFTPEQPDLNWNHPDVRDEHEDILRFWFDRGVAGVRIDSAALLIKDPELPEVPAEVRARRAPHRGPRRAARRLPGVAARRRLLRRNARAGRRDLAARRRPLRGLPAARRDAHGVQLRLHVAPVGCRGAPRVDRPDARRPRARSAHRAPGCSPTTTSPGPSPATAARTRASPSRGSDSARPTDVELGTRRARAAALLTAALPGSLYLYQGDELGLPEVETAARGAPGPDALPLGRGRPGPRRMPRAAALERHRGAVRVQPAAPGRRHRRAPWLPQPAEWAALTVQAQEADPGSMLSLYRQALRIRKRERSLGDGPLTWLPSDPTALAFRRGDDFVSVTNLGAEPLALPDHDRILLASTPLVGGMLPPDSTAWLHRSA